MYLLDTHVLLWWLNDDRRLKSQIKSLIENPAHSVYVSAVNIWEIAIKKALKKLIAPDNLLEIVKKNDFEMLAVSPEHAWQVSELPHYHIDPFDRLLVAQAQVENFTLVTGDAILKKYPVKIVLA